MEISDEYTESSVEEVKSSTSDSDSIVSSVEDIHNWSFITDPDRQPAESESIECCRESLSSDSISVISEGEDLRLESSDSVQTTSSVELVHSTQEQVKTDHIPSNQETLIAKKNVIWTTPLVLSVVLATNAAILYGQSRIYQNVMNEFKILQENRVSELLNNTSKTSKCITELEMENDRLKQEIERLKRVDVKSELEKQIHQTMLELLSKQKAREDDVPIEPLPNQNPVKNAKYLENEFRAFLDNNVPLTEVTEEKVLPKICYNKYATQDATFSEQCNFGHANEKIPKISRTLPKICYNKYATQDALFSEDCNFGKYENDEPVRAEGYSEYDQLHDNRKQKLLPSFCYNRHVTQDALFSEECNFVDAKLQNRRMKIKKNIIKEVRHRRLNQNLKGYRTTSNPLPNRRN